jgi:hypothetical protein
MQVLPPGSSKSSEDQKENTTMNGLEAIISAFTDINPALPLF